MILNLSLNCPSQLVNNMMHIKVKDTILGNELVTGDYKRLENCR